MNPRVEFLYKQLKLHNSLFANVLKDADDISKVRSGDSNHAAWLAGHLVSARYFIANLIGLEDKEPHADLFGNGKAIDESLAYPSLSESLTQFREISEKLAEAFPNVSDEQLSAEAPFNTPMGNTIGDFVAFLVEHEAYHIGQIGLIRRINKLDAMSYA